MRSNKKLIVIISIILTLAVAGAVLVYLFLMTDIFKSKEELFAQYFAQHTEIFEKITDFKNVEIYNNLKNEKKYESSTNIKMTHSEGGEISNPLNDLSLNLEIQKNSDEQYLYADGKIQFENETYLEAEVIKEDELYGVRIPEAVEQFVSIKNDENLQNVSDDIEIDISDLQDIMNILDGNVDEIQLNLLKDKYLNIIANGISNGIFDKQSKVVITVDNVDVQTNAYSVLLNSELVQNLLIEILNNLKNETVIMEKISLGTTIDDAINRVNENTELPEIKITVYEQNKQTVRTIVKIGENETTIECSEQDGEIKSKINYLDKENHIELEVEITKVNVNQQENLDVVANVTEGEENYIITFSNKMQNINNQLEFNTEISHKQDITTMSIILENKVNIGTSFEKKQSLNEAGNVTLNTIQQQRRKDIIDLLEIVVPQTINERIALLGEKFGIKNEQNIQTENPNEEEQITQVEINKFNSKFEFYTGDEVSYENVKMLLDIVKNNITGHTIGTVNMETENESDTENEEKTKKIITLYIEKDKTHEESITKALEAITNDKKYKVSISYKDTNGLIDYITITEI